MSLSQAIVGITPFADNNVMGWVLGGVFIIAWVDSDLSS